jgi:small multidrug resistance family-3 protein
VLAVWKFRVLRRAGSDYNMAKAAALFILAGLMEIGGGYLVWLWLRENRPCWYGIIGGVILFLYGIIPTMQSFPQFGRIYAAYGGVFIVLSLLWGWGIDRKTPDFYDGIEPPFAWSGYMLSSGVPGIESLESPSMAHLNTASLSLCSPTFTCRVLLTRLYSQGLG